MQGLPLSGIRVVSFEHFGAAPYATMFLADLGAEVIKIETGSGDFARQTGPLTLGENDSLYFQTFNQNKKSLLLDLSKPEDRARFEGLVVRSHAVVNNLRGNLPEKLRIDRASLKEINPAIVCGHISAYGRRGSRAAWPGFDFLMQAEAGLMSLTGEPDGPPTRNGVSMIDYMAGTMLAIGVVSAIRAAECTGEGCEVDISLFDAAIHQLAYQGVWELNEGIATTRVPRSAHPSTTPVQLFKSRDGWLFVACMTQKFWTLLTTSLDMSGLSEDPRFATLEARQANRVELTAILDEVFCVRDAAEWMAILGGRVPAAPVYDLTRALEARFLVEEADMICEVQHPVKPLQLFANPLMIDGKRLPKSAAPALGSFVIPKPGDDHAAAACPIGHRRRKLPWRKWGMRRMARTHS